MNIAISSDHHYSNQYLQFSDFSGKGGINSRLAEMLVVEDRLYKSMKEHKVSLHIRAGDLFDRKNYVDSIAYAEVAARIMRNMKEGINEIILKGNHDEAAGGVRSTLEVLRAAAIADITDREVKVLAPNEKVHIYLVPFTNNKETLKNQLDGIPKDLNKTNILVGHFGVQGFKGGTEFPLPYILNEADIHKDRWSLIILGHTHEPQDVGKIYSVGSVCQRSFSDEGAGRSWICLDLETYTATRVPLLGPRFRTLTVDWNFPEEKLTKKGFNKWVKEQIGDYYADPLYVRVKTKKPLDQKMVGEAILKYAKAWDMISEYTTGAPALAPRAETTSSWEETLTKYVEEHGVEFKDQKKRLLADGLEILHKACPNA